MTSCCHLVTDAAVAPLLSPASRRQLGVEVRRMVRAASLAAGLRDRGGRALDYEVTLRLTDDGEIHALNRAYRKKDKPTDVLAFAQLEGPAALMHPALLGDVVVSLPTAKRQAKRRGDAGLFTEVRFLAAHGLCHLLGYDHQDDAQEAEMNARMARLIAEAARRGTIRAA